MWQKVRGRMMAKFQIEVATFSELEIEADSEKHAEEIINCAEDDWIEERCTDTDKYMCWNVREISDEQKTSKEEMWKKASERA